MFFTAKERAGSRCQMNKLKVLFQANIIRLLWLFQFAWLISMFILVFSGGVRHDYFLYLKEWRLAFSDQEIWMSNTYGPVHMLLAYLTYFGPLGPKIFICASFATMETILLWRLQKVFRDDPKLILIHLLIIPLNGLIIFSGFWYGLNDLLVASFIMAAIMARFDRKFILVGILIGLAALIKFYPILFLPFLMFDERCIRLRPLVSALLLFAAGIGLSWLILGNSTISAWVTGSARPAKLLSVLASLRVHSWLVGGKSVVKWLTNNNTYMVFSVNILAIIILWRSGLSWLTSFIVGVMAVFLTYKVGHPQFYITWLAAVACLPLLSNRQEARTVWICLPFALFLSFFQSAYTLGTKMMGPWMVVRENVGFFTIILGIATIYFIFLQHRRLPKRSFSLAW